MEELEIRMRGEERKVDGTVGIEGERRGSRGKSKVERRVERGGEERRAEALMWQTKAML